MFISPERLAVFVEEGQKVLISPAGDRGGTPLSGHLSSALARTWGTGGPDQLPPQCGGQCGCRAGLEEPPEEAGFIGVWKEELDQVGAGPRQREGLREVHSTWAPACRVGNAPSPVGGEASAGPAWNTLGGTFASCSWEPSVPVVVPAHGLIFS